MSASPTVPASPARLAPLMPLAIAMAVGILVDRHTAWLETGAWLRLACGFSVIGGLTARRRWLGPIAICLAWGAVAGGWHHFRWYDVSPDDLARGVDDTPRPAWVRGVVRDVPGFYPGDGELDAGFTRVVLDLTDVHHNGGWIQTSGRVLATIAGDRSDLEAGTSVEAAGTVALTARPLNPGEFDYRAFLQVQGVRLRLSVDEPTGIWSVEDAFSQGLSISRIWMRWVGVLRQGSYRTLTTGLRPETAALAAALLLGRREGVAPEVNDAFARTGTSHLLAISGLHMQVLALAMTGILRLLGLRRKRTFLVVGMGTLAYAILVGLMPSVVRSAVMTCAYCLAGLLSRRSRPANTLALAAIATLALNPAHLFDVGCQLSFLAVGAIVWGATPVIAWIRRERELDPLTAVERHFAPGWTDWPRRLARGLAGGVSLSLIVWGVGLPLVALRFHLISPISILLNLPLIPVTSLALLTSGVSLGLGLIWEPLAVPTTWLNRVLLEWTAGTVRWGAGQGWGYTFVAGPPWGWVCGVYLLLAFAIVATRADWPIRRSAAGMVLVWVLGGLGLFGARVGLGLAPKNAAEIEFLAVGHGLAVVIETEPGHAILYDCGRMRDPSVGRRIIAPALWSRGVRRLDAVLLSHADADHFNGLPDLLDRFRIERVLVPEGFEDPRGNPAAAQLVERVREHGVGVGHVRAGDDWSAGGFRLTVLHPPAGWRPTAPDNAHSLVLEVARDGRRVLLTGDLEGDGLLALTATPRRSPFDVMLAPHHGGKAANPDWLYAWADPRRVVVSQRPPQPGTRDVLESLKKPLLRTWREGALTLQFQPGAIVTSGFLDDQEPIRGRRGRALHD